MGTGQHDRGEGAGAYASADAAEGWRRGAATRAQSVGPATDMMLDMANLGKMLGGSFLPGIEVGREAGRAQNWSLVHGATKYFPDLRFHPAAGSTPHQPGMLTKDLAVPWFNDFISCDETYWPTSRPQIVYQEQILRIVREIGDFSWTHAAYIRKIISRKIGEQEFNRQKETFQEGARRKGLDDETIDAIWGACITAGGYAFNVPHCVSYGMLGFWTMYLKRHHPVEFFAAAFRKLADWKLLSLLRDAHRHGIEVLPPSLTESNITWEPAGPNAIRAGYDEIPGIGEATASSIMPAEMLINIISHSIQKRAVFTASFAVN